MDQAEGLRTLMKSQENRFSRNRAAAGETKLRAGARAFQQQVIAVASGKGGVGKTNFCVNFALQLQKHERRPLVLDVDIGFANVELLLGERPEHSLFDVLNGLKVGDIIQMSRQGLPFVSGGSGLLDIHGLQPAQIEHLLCELEFVEEQYDTLLLDCGAGHGANEGRVIAAADELILVTTPEPTAIADAYALTKILKTHHQLPATRIVVNRASSIVEAKSAAEKLQVVAERFLGVKLGVLGYILEDTAVSRSVVQQEVLVVNYPRSKAAGCFEQIARNYLHLGTIETKTGLPMFFERLLRARIQ